MSFDYLPLFEADGAESFSVSLVDPFFTPVIPTDADPLDSFETFYFMHDWDDYWGVDEVLYDPSYVTMTDLGSEWTRVTLDLASLGGVETDALLVFDFIPSFGDYSLDGQIKIDNVSAAIIPAPSALLLSLVGLGSFGVLRRKCKQLLPSRFI